MTTSQITTRSPGTGVTPRSATGSAQAPEVFDTGRLGGNVVVVGAGVVEQQKESNGHLHEMRAHLKALSEASTGFNAAIGIKSGEPAATPTLNFTLDHTSIDKFVGGFTTSLTTATATAVSKQIEDVHKHVAANQQAIAEMRAAHNQEVAGLRLRIGELTGMVENHRREIDGLRRQQSTDETIDEVTDVVRQGQLSELSDAVRYLEGQVYTLTHPTPPPPTPGQSTPDQPKDQPAASQSATARPSQPAGGTQRGAGREPEAHGRPTPPPRGR